MKHTHTRTRARTHARTHERKHAHTHTHTHIQTDKMKWKKLELRDLPKIRLTVLYSAKSFGSDIN